MHHRDRRAPSKARKGIAFALSALLLLGYYSPTAGLLRRLPSAMILSKGQSLRLDGAFPLQVSVLQGDTQVLSSQDERLGTVSVTAQDEGQSRLSLKLFGLLPLRDVAVQVQEELILSPGGQAIGVALRTGGVLVVGLSELSSGGESPARAAGLKSGDMLLSADGAKILSAQHLMQLIAKRGASPMQLTVQRGEKQLSLNLTPHSDEASGDYKIGAWVRDSTAGVGTLSFYYKDGLGYGALGHAIADGDTGKTLPVGEGQLMLADVVDVKKGQRGVPGELKGSFLREGRAMGDIQTNNEYGIYGRMDTPPEHPLYPGGLPIGRKDAVHTGKATILCTLGEDGMQEYAIEIVRVTPQAVPTPKSMVIKVTDPRLIERTGGIVQGMSGSPILQDGRIVGAVTHVYVNDPTMGYGLYIEWMLEQTAGRGDTANHANRISHTSQAGQAA